MFEITKFYCLNEYLGIYYLNPDGVSTSNGTEKLLNLENEKIREKYSCI
jgi:hypothetical protein